MRQIVCGGATHHSDFSIIPKDCAHAIQFIREFNSREDDSAILSPILLFGPSKFLGSIGVSKAKMGLNVRGRSEKPGTAVG